MATKNQQLMDGGREGGMKTDDLNVILAASRRAQLMASCSFRKVIVHCRRRWRNPIT